MSIYRRQDKSATAAEEIKAWLTIITIVGVISVLGVLGLAKFFGGLNIQYSQGQRTGLVFKIASEKGLIWKTCEGELSLQLTTRDSKGNMVNQVFAFSVSDTNVARQLEAAAATGNIVTVHYKQYLLRGYKYGSTGYDVDRIIVSPSQQ